jgi:hypothetical protein
MLFILSLPYEIVVVIHNPLCKSKLQYASVIWENLTWTDANRSERIKNCQFVIIDLFNLMV